MNQSRQVTVTGGTVSGNTTAMTQAIHQLIQEMPLPDGYTVETAGSYEEMMESFTDLLLALWWPLVWCTSCGRPVRILPHAGRIISMRLPVAFGAVALPVTGRDLSMISLVALIMLAVLRSNSYYRSWWINQTRREMGESREEATS